MHCKLGSASSKIFSSDTIFFKSHRLSSRQEAETIVKGAKLLEKTLPGSVELPIHSSIIDEQYDKTIGALKGILLRYEQLRLEPWIEPNWIGSAQLEELGALVLLQQRILLNEGMCLVDARPSNYWLGSKQPRMVDLASIKDLSQHSLASFLADFRRNFIQPLLLEQQLGLAVGSYFKAGLESQDLRLGGLSSSYAYWPMAKELVRQTLTRRLSALVSSASIDFIRFLGDLGSSETQDSKSSKALKSHAARRLNRMELLLKKVSQREYTTKGDWAQYAQVHNPNYTAAKQKAIEEFLSKSPKGSGVADLGANLTNASHQKVSLFIDQDLSVCREIWGLREGDAHVLQLDVAKALTSPGSETFWALNLDGSYQEALVLGLVHHLQIDAGLAPDAFYRGLSQLYKRVLLEFPSRDDPMIQLLMRKKGENLRWSWEDQQINAEKYFTLNYTKKLSETRHVALLETIR